VILFFGNFTVSRELEGLFVKLKKGIEGVAGSTKNFFKYI
jgi:hypothetical protein